MSRRNILTAAVLAVVAGVGVAALAQEAGAQQAGPRPPAAPAARAHGPGYRTEFVPLGVQAAEALVYIPENRPQGHIGLVFAHPNGNVFQEQIGAGMAARGFPIAMVNVRAAADASDDPYARGMSQAIRYMRTVPGVTTVVLVGHSGGGHLAAFYENVAENGPGACSGPEKIVPCQVRLLGGLEKPDGLVLIDPTLGAFHPTSGIDPAYGTRRNGAIDMFAAANGYDEKTGTGHYSAAFAARFHAAQAERSNRLIADTLARVKAIDAGRGAFTDDEPMVIPGMGVNSAGARLYQPDTSLLAHTRGTAYVTHRADGTVTTGPLVSSRPVLARMTPAQRGSLESMGQTTTARGYLAGFAVRLNKDFGITADGISGVDWRSAYTATPGNAEGIKVPTLVMVMGCHYLVVPGEITYEHLAARDKTLTAIEGATHLFNPCKPEYGNTAARVFDTAAAWLNQPGRF
jgi:pimeloyl-ACP methyl ester carboxylesterase